MNLNIRFVSHGVRRRLNSAKLSKPLILILNEHLYKIRIYIFLSALIVLSSCTKERFNKIEPVVERDLIKFENTEIPSKLKEILNSKQILIFGETHYVEEHQEYVSNIIEYLSVDSLIFLTESSNAFN
jgi:hypothetical protein